jgi:transketolase
MSDLVYIPLKEFQRIKAGRMDSRRAEVFANAARLNALYAIKRANSGHIGSSFSSLDIVSWLYLVEMGPEDIYFSSKGHDVPGLYAVLAGVGKMSFEEVHRLRRLGGLPGHPDVSIPALAANTGSLGMGISKAKGIVWARRLQKKSGRVFVLTGDGELQEGQIWESLPQAAHLKMGEITAIVDANKIQSDLWVSKVNDTGDIVAKAKAFGWHAVRVNGHDFDALGKVLSDLRSITDRPKLIVADTVKGRGVSFMEGMDPEARLYHYHSGAPGDMEYDKAVDELVSKINRGLADVGEPNILLEKLPQPPKPPIGKPQNLLASYARELVHQAEKNPQLVVLDGDLAKDCGLLPFEKKFPERFIECGIAEQDMVSQAGGMARQGLLPVVHSFSCFLSARPNEQIYNNALEGNKIIYVGSLAGFLPAGPGTSHQAVRDISTLSALPNLNLIEPSCNDDLANLFDFVVNESPEAAYFRLVSVSCDVPFQWPTDSRPVPGQGVVLTEGKDAVLFTSGPLLLTQAYHAVEALAKAGVHVRLVAMPWLNRVDARWLQETVGDRSWVLTLDNHYLNGGLGERLLASLAESAGGGRARAFRFGLSRKPVCGSYDEVLKAHRMDSESLAEDIGHLLKGAPSDRKSRAPLVSVLDSDIG